MSGLKTVGKTIVVVVAVAAVHALVFGAQLEFGVGPASEPIKVPAGSPEWFAAAERSVAFDTFVLWPLLIIAGAAAQRLWCPESPAASVLVVILPALLAHEDHRFRYSLIVGAVYGAVALGTALVVYMVRRRRS